MARLNANETSVWKEEKTVAKKRTLKTENDMFVDDYDDFEEMTDEELDDIYRPRKMNSPKNMVSLLVGEILREETDENHKMSQAAIVRRLAEFPYEVKIERKAVGRTINGMADWGLGYCYIKGKGAWYDKKSRWY